MAIYYLTIAALTGLGYFLTGHSYENQTLLRFANSMIDKKRKDTLLFLAVSFFAFVFLASFRYAIGFDYFSYRNIYEKASVSTFREILSSHRHEPLLYLICRIFNRIGCPYHIFLIFINTFLIFTAMWFIYHYSKLPWLSIYFFITMQFLAYNMNLLRQSIAVCFFLLAYPCLKDKKLLRYTLLILAGGFFHNSLFLMWPLYFFLTKKHSKQMLIGIAVCTIAVYIFFDPIFAFAQPIFLKRHANYANGYYWQPDSFVYVILPALYMILVWIFGRNIKDPVKQAVYLNSALYQGVISLFITKHFILERFAIYPFAISLIAIPEIVWSYLEYGQKERNEAKKRWKNGWKHNRAYYGVLLIFVVFGGAYFLFAVAKGFHGVYPYVSLLKRSVSVGGALL